MSGEELMAWQTFYSVEPFGSGVEDQRAGVVASVLANVFRDKKQRDEPFTAADFFQRTATESEAEKPSEPMKPAHVLRMVEAMTLALGGQDKRQRRPRYD